MGKREDTRRKILRQALSLCSEVGLEGLTIGVLAKAAGMSKSGLYAHFESKENLQCAVLDTAADLFVDSVVAPALKEARGIPRLERLFGSWLAWEEDLLPGGCPFVVASVEFDDRPGPVRKRLVAHMKDMLGVVARGANVAVDEGHFRSDLDVDQFAHDYWANVLVYHHFVRLLEADNAKQLVYNSFHRLIDHAAVAHTH